MAIIIKEILVKTTVEKPIVQQAIPDEALRLLKASLLKELEHKQKRQTNWRKER